MEKIQIGDYFLFFCKKAHTKNIRLRFDRKGNLILTAPWFCRKAKAVAFAQQNIDWIQKHAAHQISAKHFQNGDVIMLLGKTYTIFHNPLHKGGVLINDNQLIVGGEETFIHRRITDFAKQRLYEYMQEKVLKMAAALNEKPTKIVLRDTSSRWGSCSSNKRINFCWKLAFAPLFVIDYIAAHETAHLKEMNHGPVFWQTVAKLNVQQAEAQIWLRKHGRELQAVE